MDLEFDAGYDQFRSEVRDFLARNKPPKNFGLSDGNHPDRVAWLSKQIEHGYWARSIPAEYGGFGAEPDLLETVIMDEEFNKAGVTRGMMAQGPSMLVPTLLNHGSEEQRKRWIGPTVRGEVIWCQGYSEPGSGSDLASLQTRASEDGDDFIINGQKVWTSYADHSDWIFALVRSNSEGKKQEGITFILIDMESPGVSVNPIQLISGKSPFCETYFEDVRVPVENVVHKIDAGWTVAKALLGHERTMIAKLFGGGRDTSGRGRLVEMAAQYLGEEADGRIADPHFRSEIAQSEMDTTAFRYAAQRMSDQAKAGHQPGAESSMFKIVGTENNMRRSELEVRISGPQALGWEGPGFEQEELDRTRAWLRTRGNSLEGGSSEIQLNIIAKHVLGLPD
jgi:acyl-CoA dehydrogenase